MRPGPIVVTAIVAIACRAAYLAALRAHPELLEPVLDAAANLEWARGWLAGTWPGSEPFFRAPGAIVGIAVGLRAAADDPVRLACAQILLGALTPVLVALLAKAVFGVRAAWIAGIGAALYPMFAFHDGQLLDSFLQMPLFVGAVLASWHAAKDGRARNAALAGALWGAVGVVRPPLFLGAPVAAAAIALGSAPARRRLVPAMLFVACALALPLWATARNAAAGDLVFIASQGGLNLYLGNARGADGMSASFPDDPSALGYAMVESAARIASASEGRPLRASEASRHWTRRTIEGIRAAPGDWGRLLAKKSLLFWTQREIPNNHDPALFAEMIPGWGALPGWGFWAPFGIAGLVLLRRHPGARFLGAIVGVVFATSVLFFVAARFRLPAAPMLIVLAAGGADAALRSVREGGVRSAITFAAIGVLAVVAFRWNPYRIPEEPWVISYVLVAEAEKNRGELGRALGWIERALEQEPGLYAARRAQVDLLRRFGRFAEGREIAARLVEANPRDAAARADLGVLLDLSGASDSALVQLDAALAIDPQFDAARVHRGVVLARLGRIEEARAELLRFLREHPQSPEAPRAHLVLSEIARGAFPEPIDPPRGVP